MRIEEVKDFLRSKNGYLKEGKYRLAKKLNIRPDVALKALKEVRAEYKMLKVKVNKKPQGIKRLFYDIETSYNIGKFWRSGYNQTIQPNDIIHERAILTIAWKWENEDKVNFMSWDNGCDKKLVEKFISLMNEADEIVGHNVERYDTAFIMGRAFIHGIYAFPKYKQYDTLKKAKYTFNLNSNKLDYLAKVVGLGGKYQHSGMKMWDDIILYDLFKIGNKEDREHSMKEMLHYNCMDVILTEEVFNRLRLYATQETHHGVLMGKPKYTCPNDGSNNVEFVKTVVTANGTIKVLMKCKDCGQQYFISNKEYLKFLKIK